MNAISRLIALLLLAGITPVSAVPLTQLIVNENDKLTAKVGAWNKECGGKPYYDQDCMKRRYKLCGELGEFVALASDEIVALENVSPDASTSDKGEFEARRKVVEHLIHVALNNIKCLGRSDDSHCRAELTADVTESTRSKKKIADVSHIGFVSSNIRDGATHITIRNNNPYPIRGISVTVKYYAKKEKLDSPEHTGGAFVEGLIMTGQELEFDLSDSSDPSLLIRHGHGMPDEWIAIPSFDYAERVDQKD